MQAPQHPPLPGLPPPPDPEQGLGNLMASLVQHLGGAPLPYAPLGALAGRLAPERPLVLLIVDGMGEAQLQRHLPGGLLQGGRLTTLASVFPSTTASAVGTLITGLAPASHGLTGWHLWAEEVGELLAVLPLLRRQGEQPDREQQEEWARRILAAPDLPIALPLAPRTRAAITHVAPSAILYSPFNRELARGTHKRGYLHLAELFEQVQAALEESGPEPRLIQAYWPDFDSISHEHGPDSQAAGLALQTLEQALGSWLQGLPRDARRPQVLVTADHGFITAPPERLLYLDDYPELHRLLRQPLSGERRAAYAHLHPGCEAAFVAGMEGQLGHALWAVPSRELLRQGWFGPGPRHPRLDSRIGDVTLILKDDWTLTDRLAGAPEHPLLGMHGGVSAAERQVPLCLFD